MERSRITKDNITLWPKFEQLLKDEKIRFDGHGRLRYLHGAPVGDMIFVRVDKNNLPIYKESAEEWFDPGSPKANDFVWS